MDRVEERPYVVRSGLRQVLVGDEQRVPGGLVQAKRKALEASVIDRPREPLGDRPTERSEQSPDRGPTPIERKTDAIVLRAV